MKTKQERDFLSSEHLQRTLLQIRTMITVTMNIITRMRTPMIKRVQRASRNIMTLPLHHFHHIPHSLLINHLIHQAQAVHLRRHLTADTLHHTVTLLLPAQFTEWTESQSSDFQFSDLKNSTTPLRLPTK